MASGPNIIDNNPPKRKKHRRRRRRPTKKQLARRRKIVAISIVAMLVLIPITMFVAFWWSGWLPTREELPRYKEKILIMLSGWQQTRLPEGEVIGIDISHYQGDIQWEELCFHIDNSRKLYKNANNKTHPRPVDFVVAKATQGANHRDSHYNRYKQGAREQRIIFGAYHFYSWKAGAKAQADNYIQTAQLQQGDIVPVLDVEDLEKRLPPPDSVLCWLNTVETYYNQRPIIYTGEKCYLNYFHPRKEFRKYTFWIARYGGKEPSHHHILWQCSESGKVGGCSRPVDINIFRGNKTDLLYKYTIN